MFNALIRRTRTQRPDRGAVMVVAIAAVVMAMAAAALGVDLGRISLDKRSDQNVADLAALDAARAVGFILNSTDLAGYNTAAQAAATKSAARNGFSGAGKTVTATVGSLDASNNFVPTGSSAVQVVTTSYLDYAFMPGGKSVTATGVAFVGTPIAAFSVGTTLANLDTSKSSLDSVLRSWLGTGSLSAVSYSGLANSNLKLSALQTALLAQGLSVGTTQQLLDQSLTVAQLFQATATALTTEGKNVAAAEVTDIVNASISNSLTLKLSEILDVATPSDSAALTAETNVYQLVMASAQAANGTNFVSVPATGISVPGLSSLALSASVIEPAQTAIGPVGSKAANSQVTLRLRFNLNLGGLLPLADVTLNYTTAASEGELTSIVCGVSPSIAVRNQGSAIGVTGTAAVPLGTLNLSSSVAQTAPTTLSFSNPTEFSPTYVGKHAGAASSGVSLASVSVSGSNVLTAAVATALQTTLPTTLGLLDAALLPVVRPLLQGLGVEVGQSDVTALGIYPSPTSCGGTPRLAK